jgi:hypothetical protein
MVTTTKIYVNGSLVWLLPLDEDTLLNALENGTINIEESVLQFSLTVNSERLENPINIQRTYTILKTKIKHENSEPILEIYTRDNE